MAKDVEVYWNELSLWQLKSSILNYLLQYFWIQRKISTYIIRLMYPSFGQVVLLNGIRIKKWDKFWFLCGAELTGFEGQKMKCVSVCVSVCPKNKTLTWILRNTIGKQSKSTLNIRVGCHDSRSKIQTHTIRLVEQKLKIRENIKPTYFNLFLTPDHPT